MNTRPKLPSKSFIALAAVGLEIRLSATALSQDWVPVFSAQQSWVGLTCSADGTNVFASDNGVYASANSGATWELRSKQGAAELVSSFDGAALVGSLYHFIVFSTNSGSSWITNDGGSVAISADGVTLYSADIGWGFGGNVTRSTNSGTRWTITSAPRTNWYGIACSASGAKVAAVHATTQILISTNFGTTWRESIVPGATNFYTVAWSADGNTLFAIAKHIYSSNDSGLSWKETSAPYGNWYSVACSADGSKVTAIGQSDTNYIVYSSTNSGLSWVSNDVPNQPWSYVCCSADGGVRFLAAAYGGEIYKSETVYPPKLAISDSSLVILLSWIVPSTSFVLQRSSDLTTSNWVNVATAPTVNYTNLHYELRVAAPTGTVFYRLVSK
jgi:hypothetical protein